MTMDSHIKSKEVNGIYDIPVRSLDGQENMLEALKGKVTMFLPVATKCGYEAKTDQAMSLERTHKKFQDLQVLHEEFSDRGFSVIAIPTNQLGEQEPCENEEILEFLKSEYPYVTFPFTEKMNINPEGVGDGYKPEHSLALYLKGYEIRAVDDYGPLVKNEQGVWEHTEPFHVAGGASQEIHGLFEKFLFDRDGQVETRFNYAQEPLMDKSIYVGGKWTVREAVDFVLKQPRRPKHVGHEWHYPDIGPVPSSLMPKSRPFDWKGLGINEVDRYSDEDPPPTDLLLQHCVDVVWASLGHLNNEDRLAFLLVITNRLQKHIDTGNYKEGK